MPKTNSKSTPRLDQLYPRIKTGDVVVELARSARSTCKTCTRPIVTSTLRVGSVTGPTKPGFAGSSSVKVAWYHLDCFRCEKDGRGIKSLDDIYGYDDLEESDQSAIRAKVAASAVIEINTAHAEQPPLQALAVRRESHIDNNHITWGYAKSSATKCRGKNGPNTLDTRYKKPIYKDTFQVHCPKQPEWLEARTLADYGMEVGWRHLECFIKEGDGMAEAHAEMILEDDFVEKMDKNRIKELCGF
ncbi:hypothetical protein HDV00_011543 [Rhizophlyctis rosea]|nr:hypothetical protein HDV00_011543 [Rhizophlyctis rosea]